MHIDPELRKQIADEGYALPAPDEELVERMDWDEFQVLKDVAHRERVAAAAERDKALERIYVANEDSSVETAQEDWDEEERRYSAYLLDNSESVAVGGATTMLMKAVGGPYDGMPINVPPGGSSVAMPSAFGKGDMHGSSLYERYITDAGDTVMLYVGQGDQVDDEAYTPKLILPGG